MASHRRTRIKELIDEYFSVIVLVLVVLAAGGAWATYTTTVGPGSHTEQHVVSSWGVSGGFNYSATAVNATPIFDRGAVRAGQKFYFTNSMPVLDGRFAFDVEGGIGNATVTTQTTLINYAVYTKSGISGPSGFQQSGTQNTSERRLWEITTTLGTERHRIEPGETATTTFSIDISDIRKRVGAIGRALGPISRITDARTTVAISVHVNGTIDGQRVIRSFNYTLPINSSTGYYVVYPPQKPDTTQFDVTRVVTVPNDYGTLSVLASVIGLVAPLVALAGLFYGRENDWFDVSQTERAEAQRTKLRAEFEEWITAGAVATDDDRTTVTVDSLPGLVDIAIDSDRRVIEDDTGTYVVLDDDVRYQFTPELPTETAAEADPDDGFDAGEADTDGDATGDTSVDVTVNASTRSDDGEDGRDTQPTAVVDFADSSADDDRESGTESEHENTDGRSTDTDGVMQQLRSTVESALGSSNETGTEEASEDEPALTDLHHVGESRAATLREAGFRTIIDVREATPAELQEIGNIGATRAEQIRDSAEEIAETTNESEEEPSTDTRTTDDRRTIDDEEDPNSQ